MAISTNGTIITRLAGALYNEYLSNASYTELNTTPAATVAANMLSSDFAGKTDLQIATTVLSNLGLSSVAGLNNWVAAQLTGAGSTATAKGAKLVSMLNDFAMMTADATYGSYATTFNSNTAAGLTSSQTAKSAGGAFATAAKDAAAAAAAEKAAAEKAAADKAAADKAAADKVAAAEEKAAAAEKAAADKAAAAEKAAADKVIADAAAAKAAADAAAAKVIADAEAAAKEPITFTLTTGLDTGSKFTGKNGDDTFVAVDTQSVTTQTLTSGDSLVGGAGADTLQIAASGGGAVAAPLVASSSVETLNVTNNNTGLYTLNASLMNGLKTVQVTAGASDLTVSGHSSILDASLVSTSRSLTLDPASGTSGVADSMSLTINGSGTAAANL